MIEKPNLPIREYGELLEYNETELAAVKASAGIRYKLMNSLLVNDGGMYEIRNGMENDFAPDRKEIYVRNLVETIEDMPRIYMAALKSGIVNGESQGTRILHRGTSRSEIDALQKNGGSDKPISATSYARGANFESYILNENKSSPVHMRVMIEPGSRSVDIATRRD